MCMKLVLSDELDWGVFLVIFQGEGYASQKAFLWCEGEYVVTPLVFPWSVRCPLGIMVLIIFFFFFNHPVTMVSHLIEGCTATGSTK